MMRPVIGVMPLMDQERESLWMLPGYFDVLTEAGGLPVMFPLTKNEEQIRQLIDMADGILFTGGHDVSPELYGENPVPQLGSTCIERDRMEQIALKYAMEQDKPVLGICRGIQLINAALGGTLYQDLPTMHPSEISHRQERPYDKPSHEVTLVPDAPLMKLTGKDALQVNSCHHQAIKDLAPGLTAMAVSPDGLIEAIFGQSQRFLWAVQWHPEFSFRKDPVSVEIVKAFVDASARKEGFLKKAETGKMEGSV